MARSIEIELKYEVLDRTEVMRFVDKLKLVERKRILDVYLDTNIADLFKRGIFMRMRNGKKFDIKFNLEDIAKGLNDRIEHTHCDEVSIALPFTPDSMAAANQTLHALDLAPMTEPSLENLKQRNRLIESMTVDKLRTTYADGDFHIDLDKVKDLGEYLEIEQMVDERADRDAVVGRMRQYLTGLSLKHIDVGYNELYWREHNFERYLEGKYLLIEDRRKYRPQTLGS